MEQDHFIRELKQIALIQRKIDDIVDSHISRNEQAAQIIDHMESISNFANRTIDDVASNRVILTENSLSIINHELRTPLVPIRAYSEMLLQGKFGNLQEEQQRKIASISTNAKRLQQKIDVLLDRNTLKTNAESTEESKHQLNEIAQQKIILEKINELLTEKSDRDDKEITTLKDLLSTSEHRQNELAQERSILNKTVKMQEDRNLRLTKKNTLIIAVAALMTAGGFISYSLYVTDLVGKQYMVPHGTIPTNYVIQNLRGDTIDTWLSWRLMQDSTLHVGITNGAKYQNKISLIREVILSEETVEIDDSLLHKGPKGSISTYYVGWLGALKQAAAKSTQFYIPAKIEVMDSVSGEGDITIILTDERNGDGFSGFTKSIADESQNQILKSMITIYEADKLGDEQLKTILRHEFGHAIGLAHSSAPEDLMAPTIATQYPYISECVIDSIVRLYDGGKNSQVICAS